MACNVWCVFAWISTVFAFISFPVYLLFLIVIIKYRRIFNSSFYFISIALGIADLGSILNIYIFQKIPKWLFEKETVNSTFLATVLKIGYWYWAAVQYTGVCILCLNRYTALCTPVRHKVFWRKKRLYQATVFMWVVPLIWAIPMIHPYCHSYYHNESFHAHFTNPDVHQIYLTADALVEGLMCAPFLVICYIRIISKNIGKQLGQVAPHTGRVTNQLNRKIEIKTAIVGGVICSVYLCLVVTIIISIIPVGTGYHTEYVDYAWEYFTVLFTFINPWITLVVSKNVRRHMTKAVTCGKCVKTQTPTPIITGPNQSPNRRRSSYILHGSNPLRVTPISSQAQQRIITRF